MSTRLTLAALVVAASVLPALRPQEGAATAPDTVTLTNGDRLTGTVAAMADGKLTLSSAALGDVTIPLAEIADLTTAGTVTLATAGGERLVRRITGLGDGHLQFATGPDDSATGTISLTDLDSINPPLKPPTKWTGALTVGAYLFEGNTNRRAATASADAKRRTEFDRLTFKAGWDYAEDKDTDPATPQSGWVLSQRRTSGAMQYDYFLSDRTYLLATTSALGDTLADIDLRWTAGVGAGMQWVESDTTAFSTEAGLSYFHENFRSTAPDRDYLAARVAYSLLWNIADGTRFLQDVIYLPSLEDSRDYNINKISRLQLDLTDGMFAEFKWELDYDNTPAPGNDRVDNRYFASVGWTF